jgi:hypothetical protein
LIDWRPFWQQQVDGWSWQIFSKPTKSAIRQPKIPFSSIEARQFDIQNVVDSLLLFAVRSAELTQRSCLLSATPSAQSDKQLAWLDSAAHDMLAVPPFESHQICNSISSAGVMQRRGRSLAMSNVTFGPWQWRPFLQG